MLLGGCAPGEPRSVQYFEAHLEEARAFAADCTNGTARGDECANAAVAIEAAEGRDRFKRFKGK
ncbi:hypothetical protein [Sphingopyxis granuli]|uniref:hypothetical protein n=1 Tax=Sphingopyxis granuli TaxID=267128 RepID=UPI00301E02BE